MQLFGRRALGIEQGGDGVAGVAPLGVGAGDVDPIAGLPLG